MSRRNASLSDMHGLQLARAYYASDIIDRLSAELCGRTWEGIAYMDASQWHLDAGGKPKPNVAPSDATLASSFHPFELFPDAPEWVDALSELDDATLADTLRASLVLDDGYVDRDDGGPAALAATIIALARSRELERILSPGEELAAVAKRLDSEVMRVLLDPSRTAVSRVGGAHSDVGSALPESEPARAFFAVVAEALR